MVKSFANEELEKEKFDEGNQAFLEIKKEQYRYMAGFNSTTRIGSQTIPRFSTRR